MKMKINKKQFQKWIEALDSGEYKQTRDTLQDENGYCCMGVACKVLIPENKLKMNDNVIYGSTPDKQKNAPSWLKLIDRNLSKKTKGTMVQHMNDDMKLSFSEIATMLELVYIHKAFD